MAHLHESESCIHPDNNIIIIYLLQYRPSSDQSYYIEIDEIKGAASDQPHYYEVAAMLLAEIA